MTRRPALCPDCGASTSSHTGSYCEACGTTLVSAPLPRISREAEQAAATAILDAAERKRDERETHRRAARLLADEARSFAHANDGESGLVCGDCGTVWNRLGGLRRLADLDCPACPAIYSSVAHNEEG